MSDEGKNNSGCLQFFVTIIIISAIIAFFSGDKFEDIFFKILTVIGLLGVIGGGIAGIFIICILSIVLVGILSGFLTLWLRYQVVSLDHVVFPSLVGGSIGGFSSFLLCCAFHHPNFEIPVLIGASLGGTTISWLYSKKGF